VTSTAAVLALIARVLTQYFEGRQAAHLQMQIEQERNSARSPRLGATWRTR